MLYALFTHNPHIIVTRLSPLSVQQALTKITPNQTIRGYSVVEAFDETVEFVGLLNKLRLMRQRDQEVRFKAIEENVWEEVSKVDDEHLPRLKKIIEEFGWPGFQLVGEVGADCIWLLVQHCDQDIEFQKRCLSLLEESVRKEDAPKKHLAYLTDRVLMNEGQPQIYGTQMQIIDGQIVPFPLQEPAELDKRREEMGLGPFEEYLALVKDVYRL